MTATIRRVGPVGRLDGTLVVPGDKSVSHRALIIAALAEGTSRLAGLNPGDDVAATRDALATLGVRFRDEDGVLAVEGRGWDGLNARSPGTCRIDCRNSGTTARLLLGALAGRRVDAVLTGDESLARRPMRRVVEPLRELGATIDGEERLPLHVKGAPLRGARVSTGVASAQVKGALFFAALQARGESRITEPRPTRDHSERLLAAAGAALEPVGRGAQAWRVTGGAGALRALDLEVPGDQSCAAPFVALASARPGSRLIVEGVSLNPSRIGFLRLLKKMGGAIECSRESGDVEPRGRIEVRGGELEGIDVDAAEVAAAIDEIPLLAVVATVARGTTTIRGAAELRVKESDRLAATSRLLRAFGAPCEERDDGLIVQGGACLAPARFDAAGDHRIAMCAAVAAALATGPSELGGHEWIRVSHPGFFDDLDRVGA